jgi:hypothetical protein
VLLLGVSLRTVGGRERRVLIEVEEDVLPSEYSRAISATASPILFRTAFVPSAPNASSSLDLMM